MSLNRWVFKWHLKVRMFSHRRMSADREFQVDGAATEKARRASSVCMRGMTSNRASVERRARGGAWVSTISLICCRDYGPHLMSQYSQFIGDPLPHRKPLQRVKHRCDPGSGRRLARLFWARCSLYLLQPFVILLVVVSVVWLVFFQLQFFYPLAFIPVVQRKTAAWRGQHVCKFGACATHFYANYIYQHSVMCVVTAFYKDCI